MKYLNPDYVKITDYTRQYGEKDDCAVISLALSTGESYATARTALESVGRKHRSKTYDYQLIKAFDILGYEVKQKHITNMEFNSNENYLYLKKRTISKIHTQLKTGNYVLGINGHVAALVDGKVKDWSEGRRFRINFIIEIKGKKKLDNVKA